MSIMSDLKTTIPTFSRVELINIAWVLILIGEHHTCDIISAGCPVLLFFLFFPRFLCIHIF